MPLNDFKYKLKQFFGKLMLGMLAFQKKFTI